MLFDISNLPLGGATFETPVVVPSFPWDGGGTVRCEGFRLGGRFTASRFGWELLGNFDGRVEVECNRCLAAVELGLADSFRLLVVPQLAEGRDRPVFEVAGDDNPEAVDLFCLEGATLDLESVLKEQIDLALPYRVLCREDCRGLCQNCGANLNLDTCRCEKPVDERWIGLADLKLKFESKREDKNHGRK